jgi:hypothetical protein
MNSNRPRKAAVAISIVLLGFGLFGCAGSTSSTAPQSETGAEAPAAPADLTGEWVQSNSKSEDSYQAATITADTIEISWVADGGDTVSLYWAGSYEAPSSAGSFSWDSANDTSKTDSAMLASGEPTKEFSFENDVISYQASALGTTMKIELKRK